MPCQKKRYDGPRSAKAQARGARFRIGTYYCEECRGWHVRNNEKLGDNDDRSDRRQNYQRQRDRPRQRRWR